MQSSVLSILLAMLLVAPVGAAVLSGTVVDAHGVPIRGARIDISTAAPRVGPSLFCPSCYRDCGRSERSDGAGRFEFNGLDAKLTFRLVVTASEMQTQLTGWIDPMDEGPIVTLREFPSNAPVDRVLQGRVQSAEGAPIGGALVSPCGAKTIERRWRGRVKGANAGVTDEQGVFRLLLSEAYTGVDVRVTASGYSGTIAELLTPGGERHSLTLPEGGSVSGRLTFRGTPVPHRTVAVVQAKRQVGRIFFKAFPAKTDENGQFNFQSLPSGQPYALFSPIQLGAAQGDHAILQTTIFPVGLDGEMCDLGDVEMMPGLTLKGRVVMTDDSQLPAKLKLVLARSSAWGSIEAAVARDGQFRIGELPPETYEIHIISKDVVLDQRQLGLQLLGSRAFGLRLDQSLTDLTIPLRQAAVEASSVERDRHSRPVRANQSLAGQVTDPTGHPVSGIVVTPLVGGAPFSAGTAESSADGSFTLKDLPGEPLELVFHDPAALGHLGERRKTGTVLYPSRVTPSMHQKDIRVIFDRSLSEPLPTRRSIHVD